MARVAAATQQEEQEWVQQRRRRACRHQWRRQRLQRSLPACRSPQHHLPPAGEPWRGQTAATSAVPNACGRAATTARRARTNVYGRAEVAANRRCSAEAEGAGRRQTDANRRKPLGFQQAGDVGCVGLQWLPADHPGHKNYVLAYRHQGRIDEGMEKKLAGQG